MIITNEDRVQIIMNRIKALYRDKDDCEISLRNLAEFLFKEVIEPNEAYKNVATKPND